MIQRKILCEHDYLHIPLIPTQGRKRYEVQIWDGGDLFLSPSLALADEGGEYFFLNVKRFRGRELLFLVMDSDGISEKALDRIVAGPAATAENVLYPQLYRETVRPAYHFTSKRGWLNDPNGLYFKDGVFHMYYQHNPWGTPHGKVNVSWGHAVSTDLLHWEERDCAIWPWRRDWFIASGSAVVDEEGRAGYGKGAVIAAFTPLGSRNLVSGKPDYPSGGQFFAASIDDGNTFQRFLHEAVIPTHEGKGWRDPRLFRYEDHYVAAVYETNEKGANCVTFYVSEDFHDWKRASSNDDLFECPDIFPLQVDNSNEIKWVLYGANGVARVGDFDGYSFKESGCSNLLDYGNSVYAGQTWSHHPQGKRVQISWIRSLGGIGSDLINQGIYEGIPFSQCMTIPTELTLKHMGGHLHVCRRPIEQLKQLKENVLATEDFLLDTREKEMSVYCPACYSVDLTEVEGTISILAGGHAISFDPETRILSFENGSSVVMNRRELHFEVFTDATTLELCFEDSIMATYSLSVEQNIGISMKGNCRMQYTCWGMENIWM